jgi:hypothetical protein
MLYAVYSLLLEKEKMHRFKRMYLLLSLVFSLTIPLVAVNLSVPQLSENIAVFYNENSIEAKMADNPTQENNAEKMPYFASLPSETNYSMIILSLYGLITVFFLFRLLRNNFQMLACGRNNASIDYFSAQIVLIKEKLVPHSFGKYIFVNQEDYNNGRIAEEIILHEWAHVQQKHSLDIIFMEVLIAFFWFNPICYLYKNKIKLNHEFLADESVLQNNRTVFGYQMLLINSISQRQNIPLTSNFNYLITKKRLIMMTKTTSKTRALCKKIALIPVFFVATGIFSIKTIAQNGANVLPEQTIMQDSLLLVGQGVSQELLDEYKAIERKYYETSEKWKKGVRIVTITWKTHSIPEDEWKRLYAIYIQMDKEQRWISYLRFVSPLTPIQLRSPNKDEWKGCKNAGIIWLDGKRVDNSALQSHNRHDFTFFTCAAENEDGQRIGALWTKKGYEEYLNLYGKQISVNKLLEIKPGIGFGSERYIKEPVNK